MIEIAQSFFLEAMQEGWATKTKKIKFGQLPNHNGIPYRNGAFSLLDLYCVTPRSNKSFGNTTIWYKDDPIWTMHYWGEYPKEVIGFLQEALQQAYVAGLFIGGRGLAEYSHEGKYPSLVYHNLVHTPSFDMFAGREEISDVRTGEMLGWHAYHGMSLM